MTIANQDTEHLKRIVQDLSSESKAYLKQFAIWLGVASAGGSIALVTLATKLSNPNHALTVFLPSLWVLLVGVIAAGLTVLFASLESSWAGEHFAESHNREQASQAARSIPEVFSSPQRIADEANQHRNSLIELANKSHASAERAWTMRERWRRARNGSMAVSGIGFVIGMAWPIAYVTLGGTLAR